MPAMKAPAHTSSPVQLHNHTSLLIRPNQPCYACESQLRAGSAPSEQPPSCHQSFQLTDHPGVACHVPTATARCLPHAHCCHACYPLLKCHSCLPGSQTSCAGCTWEEWEGLSYQPGTRGSGELCPPFRQQTTYRQGVGKGSYNLVTPARSIGKLMGSFSSSKVLKKTSLQQRSSGQHL